MTTPNIGRLEPVPLRTVWPHEERDFTPWLIENLDQLGEALGMELSSPRREVTLPGAGEVDILAQVTTGDCEEAVVVENQLEVSDEDHFRRLLGYGASADATVLVWVAGHFTETHKELVRWFNHRFDERSGFYAIQVEAWRIGNSVAPRFNLVAGPEPGPRQTEQRETSATVNAEFYRPLLAQLRVEGMPSVPRGGFRGRWRSFPTGHDRIVYALGLSDGKAWVYVDAYGPGCEEFYDRLIENRGAIEEQVGAQLELGDLEWQRTEGECWFAVKTDISSGVQTEVDDTLRSWMFSTITRFRNVMQGHIDRAAAATPSVDVDDNAGR